MTLDEYNAALRAATAAGLFKWLTTQQIRERAWELLGLYRDAVPWEMTIDWQEGDHYFSPRLFLPPKT